jgi:hypothetical protein
MYDTSLRVRGGRALLPIRNKKDVDHEDEAVAIDDIARPVDASVGSSCQLFYLQTYDFIYEAFYVDAEHQ